MHRHSGQDSDANAGTEISYVKTGGQANGNIAIGYQTQLNLFLGYNAMKTIDAFDFAAHPVNGIEADRVERIKLNNK